MCNKPSVNLRTASLIRISLPSESFETMIVLPKSIGKIDLSKIYQKHTQGADDVLNGIAFKGDNMLVTGKNWNKIYELKIK